MIPGSAFCSLAFAKSIANSPKITKIFVVNVQKRATVCQVQKHSGESVELTVSFGEDVLGIAGSEVVSWRIDLDTVVCTSVL